MNAPAIANSRGTRGGRKAGGWVGGVVLVVALFAGASFGRMEGTRSLRVTPGPEQGRGCDGNVACLLADPNRNRDLAEMNARMNLALQTLQWSHPITCSATSGGTNDAPATQPAATTL